MTDQNPNKNTTDPQAQLSSEGSSNDRKSGVITEMQTVKAAWDEAPEGPKKASALKHYQSAEKAQKSGNNTEAMRELQEAARALK